MKALLIDAGNSRIKWCLLQQGRVGRRQAAPWTAATLKRVAMRVLRNGGNVDAILVCSVAGQGVARALRRAARHYDAVTPVFVHSERRAAGVTNGYREPWRLGVDRWVAMIGAHARFPRRDLCIVDVGTAMTVDLLDAGGRHHGGAIVPGPTLMVSALLASTAQIRQRAGRSGTGRNDSRAELFARSTRAALRGGARYAAAGLVAQAMQRARVRLGRRPLLLLAGGGAAALESTLPSPHRLLDDLVLRGLAVLAQAQAPTG